MYQKILVPVSLEREEDGDEALNLAMALKNDGGEVVLLHVAEPIPSYAADAIPPSVLANGRKEVARQLASAAGRAGDTASVAQTSGHPGREIVAFADAHACDCIVLRSHQPGMQDYLIGSTAARVVRHAHCAVHGRQRF